MRDGVRVAFRNHKDELVHERLRVFDFDEPANNHFLCVRELWVRGSLYRRRADIVGFVNGLPLLFVECKNIHRDLKAAFERNYSDYRDTVPHLFHHNAVVMFGNGEKARIGSITSGWDHFHEWKRLAEEEPGAVDMETLLKGVCDKRNFMDLAENFIVFDESSGELRKILARNHQFLGVNRAVEAVRERKERQGRLGVFWHTQGAGQELLDGDVHPQGAPQARRQLHLPGADRPRRPRQPDLQDLRRLLGGGPRPRPLPGAKRPASEPAAGRAQAARLLAHPEVQPGCGPGSRVHRTRRHHRHHRRGTSHPVRHARPQHAQRPAQRRLDRLHRHSAVQGRRDHAPGLRCLRLDLRLPARGGGRRHRAALLRRPRRRAGGGHRRPERAHRGEAGGVGDRGHRRGAAPGAGAQARLPRGHRRQPARPDSKGFRAPLLECLGDRQGDAGVHRQG